MKNQSENLMAACAAYVAPSVELIEVSVERGFAESGTVDGGTAGTLTGEIQQW
jgi:hypothetical protein